MKSKKSPVRIMTFGILAVACACALDAQRTSATRQEPGANAAPPEAAAIVSVHNVVFPSAISGNAADPLKQVEEVVEKMHAVLARRGLGIGNMLQHTIFLKDGAALPMDVLQRFHATATRLAPGLKELRSVGTIIRVPEFPDKLAAVMLEIVAGVPLQKEQGKDGYNRIPFIFGPQEIAETIGDEKIVFTAGLEAMDFERGTLAEKIDDQIVAIVGKLNAATKRAGLSIGNMIQHNLYVTRGTDPMRVIRKFHEEVQKYAPESKKFPGVGTLMVVDGMAVPGFLMEMDAVAVRRKPESLKRVLFTETRMDVAKAVATGDLVYVSAMPGADFGNNTAMSKNIDDQIEMAVKNVHDALQKTGLSLADMVKHRIVLKRGAADPVQVRAKFYQVVHRLAPALKQIPSAETFLIVEALAAEERVFELIVIAAPAGRS
jgi:enamine deaminase RidA (YjgF/YER057c/UK114 family)